MLELSRVWTASEQSVLSEPNLAGSVKKMLMISTAELQ